MRRGGRGEAGASACASRRSRERNGAPRRTRPGRSDDDAPAADRPSSPRSTDSGPRAASAAPSPWRRRTRTARRAGCGRARVGRTQQSRSCRRCVRHLHADDVISIEPARGVDRPEENKTLVRSARSTRARPHRSARTHDAMPKSLGKRSRSGEAKTPRAPTCPHGKAKRGYHCKESARGKQVQRSASTGGSEPRKECGGGASTGGRGVRSRALRCERSGRGLDREHGRPVQGVRGREHLRAREAAKPVQGVRGLGHLRAREASQGECGGSSICEHGRDRSKCKESAGALRSASTGGSEPSARSAGAGTSARGGSKASTSTCNGRVRSQCKECGGSQICEHGEGRRYCKDCREARASSGPIRPPPTCAPREGGARDQTRAQRHIRSGRRPRRGGGVQRQARARRNARPGDRRAVTPPDISSRLPPRASTRAE